MGTCFACYHAHAGNGLAQLANKVNAGRAGRANNRNFHHDGRGLYRSECLAVRPVNSTAGGGVLRRLSEYHLTCSRNNDTLGTAVDLFRHGCARTEALPSAPFVGHGPGRQD